MPDPATEPDRPDGYPVATLAENMASVALEQLLANRPIKVCPHAAQGDLYTCREHLDLIACSACLSAHGAAHPVDLYCTYCGTFSERSTEGAWDLILAPCPAVRPDGTWVRLAGRLVIWGVTTCETCGDAIEQAWPR